MLDADLSAYLQELGLPSSDSDAFEALLRMGSCNVEELAAELEWKKSSAAGAVERLITLGLAATQGPDHASIRPAEPTTALERLAHERAAYLREARLAVLNAYRGYRKSVGAQEEDSLVEVVTGYRQIKERVRQFEKTVKNEVVCFDSPPYFSCATRHAFGSPNQIEMANLERGVKYRVVYSAESVKRHPYYVGNIQPCIAAGEQARVLPSVPVRLSMYDNRLATVAMSSVEAEANESLLIVQSSVLLSALRGLWETAWRAAHPMYLGSQVPLALPPLQRHLLGLLGTGITDETIADLLGVSRRTLSRNLEKLCQRAGATSRFQLALHAAREGWI
ncbi:helix-turn-helix domain-containing protein [Streptomyces sp. NPDC059037]|uniref:helix-turn-helix domain-containing protein n=1 Tax=Streptomyces sp. NPDC059037 TaxID=3346710 RepID=UPI00368E75A5